MVGDVAARALLVKPGVPADVTRTFAALRLPREHGFWVMLGGSLSGSLLRTRTTATSLLLAVVVAVASVGVAAATHRRVRRRGSLQFVAALALALAGVPIEAAADTSLATMTASACMKAVVFSASVASVRAAHFAPEAVVCALTAASTLVLAFCRLTSKHLKPLGLYASGLTLLATLAPLLP